jgi:hypothetical protein
MGQLWRERKAILDALTRPKPRSSTDFAALKPPSRPKPRKPSSEGAKILRLLRNTIWFALQKKKRTKPNKK